MERDGNTLWITFIWLALRPPILKAQTEQRIMISKFHRLGVVVGILECHWRERPFLGEASRICWL